MLLCVDIGNTNILLGVFDGDALVDKWRIPTCECFDISAKISQYAITDVILSSVVPNLDEKVAKICADEKITFINVSNTKTNKGIEILVDEAEVGADRIVNAVAGVKKYGTNLIILDFGTATTFDVINEKGQYVGGVIATGINSSLDALKEKTAKLPRIEIKKPDNIIGNDTITAMQSGIFSGYKGLIEGIISDIKDEISSMKENTDIKSEIKTVATGGLASIFFNECSMIDYLDADLTLNGLLHIFKLNKRDT